MPWQLQEARQTFRQVVQRALKAGPQIITRHGETVAVVVSAEEYRRLTGGKPDFADFLRSGPDVSVLDRERARDISREIDL